MQHRIKLYLFSGIALVVSVTLFTALQVTKENLDTDSFNKAPISLANPLAKTTALTGIKPKSVAASDTENYTTLSNQLSALQNELNSFKALVRSQNQKIASMTNQHQTVSDESNELSPQQLKAIDANQPKIAMQNEINTENSRINAENNFSQEVVDPNWASQAENQIQATLTKELNGKAVIQDLKCKSSVCRLEIEYDLPGENNQNPDTLVSLLDTALTKSVNPYTHKGNAVVFLGNPGSSL